jgi:hypothetical protein
MCLSARVSLYLDDAGRLFQAGGPLSFSMPVSEIRISGVDRFVDVSTGYGHMAALSDTGRLFMWGTSS